MLCQKKKYVETGNEETETPMVDWDVDTLSDVEFQFEVEVQPDVETQPAPKNKTKQEKVRVECENCGKVVNRKSLNTHKKLQNCRKKR